jgi:hypothetical protein
MLGRENAGAALSSGEVDVDFWALVFQDEEWLWAEFDAIESEPEEILARPLGRSNLTAEARPDRAAWWQRSTSGPTEPWRSGIGPGRRRQERSPPQ